jgi:hypothetical protein
LSTLSEAGQNIEFDSARDARTLSATAHVGDERLFELPKNERL